MRLPKITQLTQTQRDVYLYAPTERHVLVHGPPGTGKTLIACLRARELQKKQVPVVLGMFNKVLSRYSANAGDGSALPAETIYRWFCKWWSMSGLPPQATGESRIVIKAPFEANAQLKALGARWDKNAWRPGGWKPGAWVMDGERYQAKRAFMPADWQICHEPPKREGTSWIDWAMAAEHIAACDDAISDEALSLGTLLVDEGQDFPPSFYKMLRHLSAIGQHRGKLRVQHPLRCFVLADENQQITEENSTLEQIAHSLKIAADNRYLLLDNFRNTREIALLARAFFNDVSVLPNLPDRSSEAPTFLTVPGHAEIAERLRVWMVNNPDKEVAVLSFSEATRNAICGTIKGVLSELRGRNIVVQTYSSLTRKENRADDLVFDQGDVVTVLNLQSCKGLEFDAVFIIDLHEAKIIQQAADRFKMQMFVAVSRAREWVSLIDSGAHAGTGQYLALLPDEPTLEREGRASALVALPHENGHRDNPVHKETVRVRGDRRVNATSPEWESQLRELVQARRLDTDDKRSKPGGSFWVFAGLELSDALKPLGFQFSAKRSAWWRS